MKRNKIIFGMVGCLLLFFACNKSNEFKEFASAEGRFKVLMPGTPQEQTQNAAGMTMKTFAISEKDGAYVVAFADMPIQGTESEAQIQQRLDGALNGMVANSGAVIKNQSKTTLDGKYPGRELEADLPKQNGLMRGKVYIVDKRLYQVLVTGTKPWASSPDATKFLGSFALTP